MLLLCPVMDPCLTDCLKVLEENWQMLLEQMDNATDLNGYIAAHDRYLENICSKVCPAAQLVANCLNVDFRICSLRRLSLQKKIRKLSSWKENTECSQSSTKSSIFAW